MLSATTTTTTDSLVRCKRFSEESIPENTLNNTLTPVVKAAPAELPPEERSRGKRMMGVLMGTLSKFKSEEVEKSEANLKRILLEQRLAQKLSQAKEQLNSDSASPKQIETEGESRRVFYASKVLPEAVENLKEENEEAYNHFQQTMTLPKLYFKRAN